MNTLPHCERLELERVGAGLTIWFNRPRVRNALDLQMVDELEAVFDAVAPDRSIRLLVIRGRGGFFCAGGDVKDMARARSVSSTKEQPDAIAALNRRFGSLCQKLNNIPQTTIVVVEGAAMGGGFGLVCVCDIIIASKTAKFRLPETGLGLPPAQIAPFLVERLGRPTARRLALTGAQLEGQMAKDEGLVDELFDNLEELEHCLEKLKHKIFRCAPNASAETKSLLLRAGKEPLSQLLDDAALSFSRAARSPEGMEGMLSFLQKKNPSWVSGGE